MCEIAYIGYLCRDVFGRSTLATYLASNSEWLPMQAWGGNVMQGNQIRAIYRPCYQNKISVSSNAPHMQKQLYVHLNPSFVSDSKWSKFQRQGESLAISTVHHFCHPIEKWIIIQNTIQKQDIYSFLCRLANLQVKAIWLTPADCQGVIQLGIVTFVGST